MREWFYKKTVICLLCKCIELQLSTVIWVLKHTALSSCSNTILPQWAALVSWYGSLLTGLCYFSSWFTNFSLFKPLCWWLPTLFKDQTCLWTRSWVARLKIKLCAGFVKKCWVKCTNAKKKKSVMYKAVTHPPSYVRWGMIPVQLELDGFLYMLSNPAERSQTFCRRGKSAVELLFDLNEEQQGFTEVIRDRWSIVVRSYITTV